jgi:hypothetical protein
MNVQPVTSVDAISRLSSARQDEGQEERRTSPRADWPAVAFSPGERAGPRPRLDLHHIALRRQKPAALAAPVADELRCSAVG